MSTSSSDTPDTSGHQDRTWLALRFGWTLAEVYGRLAESPPPDTPSSSTRLFLSDLNPSPNARMWAATQRLIYLVHQLFPPKREKEKGESQPAEGQLGPGSIPGGDGAPGYPECLDDLLQKLEERMPGAGKLPRVETLYDSLNPWSRQIWALLDAEDPLLAEAATLGARLADTFWQWPFPAGEPPVSPRQDRQYLLKSRRMTAVIRQVRAVEAHLPAHVGPMLRHSLWEWGIVGQLTRSSSGQLEIAHPLLYSLRSLDWARRRRRRKLKEGPGPRLELNLKEERDLWKRLQNQMVTWEHLVFNRPLAHLLRPSDWRQVRWLSLILYGGALVLITAGGALLLAWLIRVISGLLGYLLPFLAAPTEFKDQLALATTVAAVLAFFATQFRRGLGRLRHLYDSIHDWVMVRKLEQRGLRAWDGRTKSLAWIWLQRLLRAED